MRLESRKRVSEVQLQLLNGNYTDFCHLGPVNLLSCHPLLAVPLDNVIESNTEKPFFFSYWLQLKSHNGTAVNENPEMQREKSIIEIMPLLGGSSRRLHSPFNH